MLRGQHLFPSPLWGREGWGVGRRPVYVDACASPRDPHPSPSPQGGGEKYCEEAV